MVNRKWKFVEEEGRLLRQPVNTGPAQGAKRIDWAPDVGVAGVFVVTEYNRLQPGNPDSPLKWRRVDIVPTLRRSIEKHPTATVSDQAREAAEKMG